MTRQSLSFALGSINFADFERAHVGLRWSNIWQVLPREYGSQYSWNFIFQKGFGRKKQAVRHFSSTSRGNFLTENAFKPTIEAISLGMKQELDGRCIRICIKCILKRGLAVLLTYYGLIV